MRSSARAASTPGWPPSAGRFGTACRQVKKHVMAQQVRPAFCDSAKRSDPSRSSPYKEPERAYSIMARAGIPLTDRPDITCSLPYKPSSFLPLQTGWSPYIRLIYACSEPSRDRMETAKHLHCRIARPDPFLRLICHRYRRISRPGTGYRAQSPRQHTETAPTERIWPRRGRVSDRPITAQPVRRYVAH